MIIYASPHREELIPAPKLTLSTPSCFVEWGYYFLLFYTIMGGTWGLFVSNLGSALMVILLGWCLLELRSRVVEVIGLVAFPLGCGLSYLFIQVFLHEESLKDADVLPFAQWVVALIIVQSLSLRRNFFHRFAPVMLSIGVAFLPYMAGLLEAHTPRMRLDKGVEYSHPNQLAEWYGFCTVYLTILGYITRRNTVRILYWLIAVGCLYMVTLTVSRGGLLAVAIAIVVASRHLLKSGFLPILLLACLSWIPVELGVFDEATRSYGVRGMEETGRFVVWPAAVDRFLDAPLIGVGASHTSTATTVGSITPHNGFLFLAVASGIVPFALFVAYWLRAAWAALQANTRRSPDAAFHIPLLIFTFLTVSLGNLTFMAPWAIVSLALPMAAGLRQQRLEPMPAQRSGTAWTPGFGMAK
jgi:O-antigen ligase